MNTRKSMNFSATNPTRRRRCRCGTALGSLGLASRSGWSCHGRDFSYGRIHSRQSSFQATCKRVYEALTDAKQFHQVTQLGAAVKSGMAPGSPAAIANEAGGAFCSSAAIFLDGT